MTDEEIRERLRLRYIPYAEGFDVEEIETYEQFLAKTPDEQRLYMQPLGDGEYELFVQLLTSRAVYKDPVDRYPESTDQAKVEAYPERYSWRSTERAPDGEVETWPDNCNMRRPYESTGLF